MSNHDGSCMLNEVLLVLEKYNFFSKLTQEELTNFVHDVVYISNCHDCNSGEIFDDVGKRIKYCYCCKKFAKEFDDDSGMCKECA